MPGRQGQTEGRIGIFKNCFLGRPCRRNGNFLCRPPLTFGTPAQPAFGAPAQPVADPPTTIRLRADDVRLARFEVLVEKAHKLRLVPAGADRLDLVLAAMESLVSAAGGERPQASGPAARIVVRQCPDCERAAVTTSRGEQRLALAAAPAPAPAPALAPAQIGAG